MTANICTIVRLYVHFIELLLVVVGAAVVLLLFYDVFANSATFSPQRKRRIDPCAGLQQTQCYLKYLPSKTWSAENRVGCLLPSRARHTQSTGSCVHVCSSVCSLVANAMRITNICAEFTIRANAGACVCLCELVHRRDWMLAFVRCFGAIWCRTTSTHTNNVFHIYIYSLAAIARLLLSFLLHFSSLLLRTAAVVRVIIYTILCGAWHRHVHSLIRWMSRDCYDLFHFTFGCGLIKSYRNQHK